METKKKHSFWQKIRFLTLLEQAIFNKMQVESKSQISCLLQFKIAQFNKASFLMNMHWELNKLSP